MVQLFLWMWITDTRIAYINMAEWAFMEPSFAPFTL